MQWVVRVATASKSTLPKGKNMASVNNEPEGNTESDENGDQKVEENEKESSSEEAAKEECSAVHPISIKSDDPADKSTDDDRGTQSASLASDTQTEPSNKSLSIEKNAGNSVTGSEKPKVKRTRQRKGRKVTYCSVCGKMFNRQSNLNQHMLVHTGERPWPCSICNKTFTNKSNLKQHLLMHSGVKSYVCPDCHKAFTIHSHLVRHKKIHTGEKPFVCTECRRSFTQRSNLTQHLLVHTGLKGHYCSQCAKSFASRSTLKQHLLLHAGIRPYTCPFCDKTFAQKSNLTQHVSVHHKTFQDSSTASAAEEDAGTDSIEPIIEDNMIDITSISSGSAPWSCTTCDRTFIQRSDLIEHESLDHRSLDLLEVTPSIIEGAGDIKLKDEPFDEGHLG